MSFEHESLCSQFNPLAKASKQTEHVFDASTQIFIGNEVNKKILGK